MAKAGDDLALSQFGRSLTGLRLLDDRGEVGDTVIVGDKVRDACKTGDTGRVNAVRISFRRFGHGAAGDDDRTAEVSEVGRLARHGTAVVAGEMVEAGELRIAVRRHEFVMGVDLDTGAFGLVEQALERADVGAADKDARFGADAQFDIGEFRRAVPLDASVVEQAHGTVAEAADFHRQVEEQTDAEGILQGPLQDSLQERVDALIFVADLIGFPGKAGNALEAGEDDLAQAAGVGVLIFFFFDLRKLGGILLRTCRVPERVNGKDAGSRDVGEKFALLGKGLLDGGAEGSLVRVDTFGSHAEVPDDHQIDTLRNIFHLDAQFSCDSGQTLGDKVQYRTKFCNGHGNSVLRFMISL